MAFSEVCAVPDDDLSFPEFREAEVTYAIFAYDALASPVSYVLLNQVLDNCRVFLKIFFTLLRVFLHTDFLKNASI